MDVGHASLWHPDAFTLFPFPWDVDGGDSRQQMHCGIIGGFFLQGAEYQTHGNLKKNSLFFKIIFPNKNSGDARLLGWFEKGISKLWLMGQIHPCKLVFLLPEN